MAAGCWMLATGQIEKKRALIPFRSGQSPVARRPLLRKQQREDEVRDDADADGDADGPQHRQTRGREQGENHER
jgi:hypothetical protein